MPTAGQPAPDFTLDDQDGRPVTLSGLRGRPVVLYFYPRDSTPGCTAQACAFRDARADYEAAGATVLGVSPDAPASHAKFAAKHDLPFRLLADPEKAVCRLYGVWKEKMSFRQLVLGVERTTFLIDSAGTIRRVFPKVRVNGHAAAILAAVAELAAE